MRPNNNVPKRDFLVIFGFFSSKVGGTQVLRHSDVPGGYYDIPYNEGDKAWTTPWPWAFS